MNIRLHIDRLVLDGLPVTAAGLPAVRAATEAELTRLFLRHGASGPMAKDGAIPLLKTAAIRLPSDPLPGGLGLQIARAVYGGISK